MNELVLVVDDNDANRTMMVDVLGHWGYRTVEAAHGMEAVAVARETLPDIILLDVMLPGMNGYEVCRQLKQNGQLERVPIVMLTVLDDSEARTRAINVGADLFVSKPPNYKELHKNIASLLAHAKRFREMETLESIAGFMENLLGQLSPAALQRHRIIAHYGTSAAKLLGMGEDQLRHFTLCSLTCAIEQAISQQTGAPCRLQEAVRPLNMAQWLEGYLEYQRNPVAANAADLVPAVYFVCEKYEGLEAQGLDGETALARLRKSAAGHSAQEKALEALAQVIRDEAFLASL